MWRLADECRQDLRYAGRMLGRRPGFTTAAVLTLTLGIGGNTAVFSLVDALMLKHLPVDRPDELVRLIEEGSDPSAYREAFTLATYEELRRPTRSFAGVIASSDPGGRPLEIEEGGQRPLAFLQFVSDNYFDVLGVRAFRGRMLVQPQRGAKAEPAAVISYDYWRRHYAADPSALGRRFRMRTGARTEFTIAGIAPPGFRGTEIDVPTDIWVPIDQVVAPNAPERTRGRWMNVMARLRPGATRAQAEAEGTSIVGRTVTFHRGDIGYSTLRRRLSQPLLLVAIVVVLVLAVACANLANLMLATTTSRARELAVRAAVGASRARVMRQLITESFVLSVMGGVLAIAVAYWMNSSLLGFLPPEQAIAAPNLRFALDARMLAFAMALTCATCLSFTLIPAVRATSQSATADFRSGPGAETANSWLSRGLLMSQIVMCTALLVTAAVFLRSLQNLRGQDAGYREDHLLVADIQPPRDLSEEQRDQLIEQLHARLATMPDVETAAFSHVGQLSGGAIRFRISFPGESLADDEKPLMIEQRVSPGFLGAMGTRFVMGRDFIASDDERGELVAIVNESFARRFLPGRNPIGARFSRDSGTHAGALMEVIGVVEDSKWSNLRDDSPEMYYRPYLQMGGSPVVRFAIRTNGDPRVLATPLLQAAQTIDRRIAVSNVVPFSDIVDRTLVIERLVAQVSAAFGALALTIAAIGLYGILAYSVVRRRREIGVRIAIGAPPGSVEWMMMRESLLVLACGAALGLPVALIATKLMSSILFGLSPNDPASIGIALTVLTSATILAAYIPARRAAATDPILALRAE